MQIGKAMTNPTLARKWLQHTSINRNVQRTHWEPSLGIFNFLQLFLTPRTLFGTLAVLGKDTTSLLMIRHNPSKVSWSCRTNTKKYPKSTESQTLIISYIMLFCSHSWYDIHDKLTIILEYCLHGIF